MDVEKLLKRRRKAVQENNEAQLVSVGTDLANLYFEGGQYDLAIEEYTRLANIYQKQEKHLEYAVVNRGIGEAYLGLQKFEEALHHQKIYLNTVKEIKNKLEEQRALATIGHTCLSSYLDSPNPDKNALNLANKFFTKSIAVAQSLSGQASKLEIADMSARLFCNLGLVQECLGNFDKANELINKSINLCRINDLYEQLQRGYVAYASLLIKKGDNKSAIQKYNLAEEAAKKLRTKPGILAGIYLSKSEILVKLGDLRGAKNTLHKAYKLKISDTKERETIENNLRVVASMSYNEDKILKTDNENYPELKKLYEKMGDGCCELKQFDKAIEYYRKMLDVAVKAGSTESELATCYYSLAETLKDNGQFDEAVVYFEKELGLCKSLKDSLNTLSKIADTKEAADAPVSNVEAVYNRAIEACRKEGNRHEEGRMVKRCVAYLRRQKHHPEAFQMEQTLAGLDYLSSDSESEDSEAPAGSVLGADIDLDALTDVSDDSDLEQPTKTKRRSKTFHVRRNMKGETQLHSACIKGQFNVVKHLVEQGHPINVRDNCGWLPLHEACSEGRYEIVKFLLEKGAAINDRGGTQCEGITPLHDAAINGHLSVVQLLLEKGANALAKTDKGDTVLQYLKQWRSRVQLDDENQSFYETLVDEISQSLEKAGHVVDEDVEEKEVQVTPRQSMRRSVIIGLEDEEEDPTPHCSRDTRRSYSFGLEDDDYGSGRYDRNVNDYKDTIESLRRRNEIKIPPKSTQITKRSALVSSDDVVDDWLEDDIGKSVKKRKTNSPHKINSPFKPRKTNSPAKSYKSLSPAKSQCSRRSIEEFPGSPEDVEMLFDDDSSQPYYEPQTQKSPNKIINRKARQTKLTNFGHTRTLVEPDSTWSPSTSRANNFTRTSSFDNQVMDPTLSVDVRINKKLFRVPVLLSQVGTHTIKWLADEAAARYAKKEYMIPTLELETKNGANLANEDPISLLFPMGGTQAEEVEAKIIKWSVPALTERYKEACQDMTIAPCDNICQILEEMSVSLDVSNKGLKGTSLAPLCKVLNRQLNLLELDLSGNFLTNECFQFLGSSLASLENLQKLNLNCTGLQSEHLQILGNSLNPEVVYKLVEFDVSDNFLEDRCFESLALLTRKFQLKKLNLSGNNLTKDIFGDSTNHQLTLHQLEDFDVSDNDLSNAALIKLLSWLNCSKLRSINVSRNSVTPGFVAEFLSSWTEAQALKVCRLSRCHVVDSDIFKLLQAAPFLDVLDASYNNLTSISFRRLLESQITTLDLYGCNDIFQYFTDFSKFLDSGDLSKDKTLRLTLPENCSDQTDDLIRMWNDLYGSNTLVELDSRFLSLSVSK